MPALSWIDIVLLLLLGSPTGDLVEVVPLRDYCQLRQLEVAPAKMLKLAATQPRDAKQELQQLLALRYFAEEAAAVKKDQHFPAILADIEAIAQGKQAQDALGFAQEYAAKAAVALGSKVIAAPAPAAATDAVKEALAWFPRDVGMVGMLELRRAGQGSASRKIVHEALVKLASVALRRDIYAKVEKLGNVRLERIALALGADKENTAVDRTYVRLTGKADQQRLLALLEQSNGKLKMTTSKTAAGEVLTQVQGQDNLPAMALVGNSDWLIAGLQSMRRSDEQEMLEVMLDIRAGKAPNALTGPVAASLKQLPERTVSFFVGAWSPGWRREQERLNPVLPAGKSILAALTSKNDQMQLHAGMTFANAADAQKALEMARLLQNLLKSSFENEARDGRLAQWPPEFARSLTRWSESLKLDARGDTVQLDMRLDVQTLVHVLLLKLMPAGPQANAPPKK